ncbi:MAG: hypothetical protein GSR85_07790 [Desulfurococcales archaeon]|nr:hypothetical protein [Desulfurococcales archaeon]
MNVDSTGEIAEIRPILILGSYDKETKELLYAIKDEIAKLSTGYRDLLMPLLLEGLEIYVNQKDPTKTIMVEKYADKYTLTIFKYTEIENVYDLEERSIEEVEYHIARTYGSFTSLPLLRKLENLARNSFLVFIVREREETRCGEIVELVFLLDRGINPSIIYLLARSGISLSSMLKELIDYKRINYRTYHDKNELLDTVKRIIYYRTEEET